MDKRAAARPPARPVSSEDVKKPSTASSRTSNNIRTTTTSSATSRSSTVPSRTSPGTASTTTSKAPARPTSSLTRKTVTKPAPQAVSKTAAEKQKAIAEKHAAEIEELKASYEATISSLKSTHASELTELRAELEDQQVKSAKFDEVGTKIQAVEEALREGKAHAVRNEEKHATEIEELKASYEATTSSLHLDLHNKDEALAKANILLAEKTVLEKERESERQDLGATNIDLQNEVQALYLNLHDKDDALQKANIILTEKTALEKQSESERQSLGAKNLDLREQVQTLHSRLRDKDNALEKANSLVAEKAVSEKDDDDAEAPLAYASDEADLVAPPKTMPIKVLEYKNRRLAEKLQARNDEIHILQDRILTIQREQEAMKRYDERRTYELDESINTESFTTVEAEVEDPFVAPESETLPENGHEMGPAQTRSRSGSKASVTTNTSGKNANGEMGDKMTLEGTLESLRVQTEQLLEVQDDIMAENRRFGAKLSGLTT